MKRTIAFLLLFACWGIFAQSQQPSVVPVSSHAPHLASPLTPLFNGHDLSGFKTLLQEDGVDKDPRRVFRVEQGQLHFTGDGYGGIVTQKSYSNYYLRAEFAWGEGTFGARKGMTRDSGILFHVQSSKKEPLKVWPRSVEFQINEGATGDIWLVDGPSITAHGARYTSGPGAPQQYQGIDRNSKEPVTNVTGFRGPEHEMEKPHGEWNLLELIVDGNHVRFYVNGVLANEGYDLSLSSGQILFQTEGAEIFFRNIEIAPLAKVPSRKDVPLETYVGGRAVKHVIGSQTSYTYAWPGVYFEAQFTGDAVDAKVDDDQNNLYLYVDGVHKLTLTKSRQTTVTLKDLGKGRHVVRLEKTNETQSSTGSFEGFYVASAKKALPAPHYDHSIEFIGDSYTAGYGNTSRGQSCTVDDVRETTNTSEAFAPLTAKHFGAAYRVLANSGHGIVRNYANFDPGITMPVLYQYALFDKSPTTPEDDWRPDVIVIGLGTNDFSTPLATNEKWKTRDELRTDFIRTYAEFVKSLHEDYPAAHFILMASTNFDNEIINNVDAVAATLKNQGIADLEVIPFSNLDWGACHSHPSLKDEGILSKLLIDAISRLPKFATAANH